MISMLLKMTGMTALYVLLTMLLWMRLRDKRMTAARKLAVGVVYGLCAVLSTHFGVDYGHMLLNVRDIGPLAAGLFFHPTCGVIAGLIGGIERYIAGTYWGVGYYTRIACSVSTCLAGFLAALMHRFIFKRKKPSTTYAFFMGAVMEVFHMYAVLITHRSDMDMAFYVVKTCSVPMIVFTGLGMAASSTVLQVLSHEWRNPFRHVKSEDVPVSQRFEAWLFAVTLSVLLLNFGFSFAVQTQDAIQGARETLNTISDDIKQTFNRIQSTQEGIGKLSEALALTDARAIARTVENTTGVESADPQFLEPLRKVYGLDSLTLISAAGERLSAVGSAPLYISMLDDVISGAAQYQSVRLSSKRVVAGARCGEGIVQVVIDTDSLSETLNESGLDDTLSLFHVGSTGSFDIISTTGYSIAGVHRSMILPEWRIARDRVNAGKTFFTENMFNLNSYCRVERLPEGQVMLTLLPMKEVYANRDKQAYESSLADILLFTVIYVLISMLVQQIVVNNLELVNDSLDRITGGDLNEVVNVRNSSEFASLSDDINQTVSVLKGYIAAAEKRIEQELEFAYTIQDAALPKNFSFPRRDFELFAMMDPAKEIGGDFYDFFFIDSNHLALVIADVSGKGIPAALFMMRSKTTIRGLAQTGNAPTEILFQSNNTLCEGNDAEMFVTAWIGIIDLRTGEMKCANAGHEYPMLMRAGGSYELYRDKHGLALAAMENVRFREYTVQMEPGDRLFVYTDGVPEAINAGEEQYGTDRLLDRLNAMRDAPMTDILPAVRADVAAFAGTAEQFDDITMLGFVYHGPEGGRNEQ